MTSPTNPNRFNHAWAARSVDQDASTAGTPASINVVSVAPTSTHPMAAP